MKSNTTKQNKDFLTFSVSNLSLISGISEDILIQQDCEKLVITPMKEYEQFKKQNSNQLTQSCKDICSKFERRIKVLSTSQEEIDEIFSESSGSDQDDLIEIISSIIESEQKQYDIILQDLGATAKQVKYNISLFDKQIFNISESLEIFISNIKRLTVEINFAEQEKTKQLTNIQKSKSESKKEEQDIENFLIELQRHQKETQNIIDGLNKQIKIQKKTLNQKNQEIEDYEKQILEKKNYILIAEKEECSQSKSNKTVKQTSPKLIKNDHIKHELKNDKNQQSVKHKNDSTKEVQQQIDNSSEITTLEQYQVIELKAKLQVSRQFAEVTKCEINILTSEVNKNESLLKEYYQTEKQKKERKIFLISNHYNNDCNEYDTKQQKTKLSHTSDVVSSNFLILNEFIDTFKKNNQVNIYQKQAKILTKLLDSLQTNSLSLNSQYTNRELITKQFNQLESVYKSSINPLMELIKNQ